MSKAFQAPATQNQASLWNDVHLIAARQRLELALRYQHNLAQLDLEIANLIAAQRWLAQHDQRSADELVCAYTQLLASYLIQRGRGSLLVRWCDDALRACARLGQPVVEILLLRAEAYRVIGEWNAALDDSVAAVQASGNAPSIALGRAMVARGRLLLNRGAYPEAIATLSNAEDVLKRTGDWEQLETVRAELAAAALLHGDLDAAISQYLAIEQTARSREPGQPADRTLLMLGVLYRKKRAYTDARVRLTQLLARAEQRHDQALVATTTHHLAWVALNQGQILEARQLCGRAIHLYEVIDDTRGLSDALEQLGLIALAERQPVVALPYLERSLAMRVVLGNQHGAASSLRRLALAHWHARHPVAALIALGRSVRSYARLGVLTRQRMWATLRELWDCTIGPRRWTT